MRASSLPPRTTCGKPRGRGSETHLCGEAAETVPNPAVCRVRDVAAGGRLQASRMRCLLGTNRKQQNHQIGSTRRGRARYTLGTRSTVTSRGVGDDRSRSRSSTSATGVAGSGGAHRTKRRSVRDGSLDHCGSARFGLRTALAHDGWLLQYAYKRRPTRRPLHSRKAAIVRIAPFCVGTRGGTSIGAVGTAAPPSGARRSSPPARTHHAGRHSQPRGSLQRLGRGCARCRQPVLVVPVASAGGTNQRRELFQVIQTDWSRF